MSRSLDLDKHPIESYSTLYSTGFSDEHRPVHIEHTDISPIEEQRQIVRGYPPITEPYAGSLDETRVRNEMDASPLEHHVQVYSSGQSDSKEEHPKSDFFGRLGSLFKRGHAHQDFPVSDHYSGPLEEIHRHREVEPLPLEVGKYHEGFYTELPKHEEVRHAEPTQVEEDSGQIFAKQQQIQGYPEPAYFEGPLDSTSRHSELDSHPLESHVSVYAVGEFFGVWLELGKFYWIFLEVYLLCKLFYFLLIR